MLEQQRGKDRMVLCIRIQPNDEQDVFSFFDIFQQLPGKGCEQYNLVLLSIFFFQCHLIFFWVLHRRSTTFFCSCFWLWNKLANYFPKFIRDIIPTFFSWKTWMILYSCKQQIFERNYCWWIYMLELAISYAAGTVSTASVIVSPPGNYFLWSWNLLCSVYRTGIMWFIDRKKMTLKNGRGSG